MNQTTRHPRLLAALLTALVAAAFIALAAPAPALAYSETDADGSVGMVSNNDVTKVYWCTSVADTMSAAESILSSEDTVVIDVLADWDTSDYGVIKFATEGKVYKLNLHGHMIDRGCNNLDESAKEFKGFSDGDVLRVCKNAELQVYGKSSDEEASLEHNGRFIEDSLGGTFWRRDANGGSVLKGGLITGGGSDDSKRGGGVTVEKDGYLVMDSVTVAGNVSDTYSGLSGHGGGIYVDCPSAGSADAGLTKGADLTSCNIVYNHANGWGGGIYGATVTLRGTKVSYNTSDKKGGGFAYDPGEREEGIFLKALEGSQINHNTAKSDGGGVFIGAEWGTTTNYQIDIEGGSEVSYNSTEGNGGGIAHNLSYTDRLIFHVSGSHIDHNFAAKNGGGIWHHSYRACETPDTISPTEWFDEDSTVSFNTAGVDGGGMSFDCGFTEHGAEANVGRLTMEGNHAGGNGGAIIFTSREDLDTIYFDAGAKFINNSCDGDGGAIYLNCNLNLGTQTRSDPDVVDVKNVGGLTFEGNSAGGSGGAIYSDTNDAKIDLFGEKTTVFKNNSAKDNGGAIFVKDHTVSKYALSVKNAEFTGNTVGTKDAFGWGGAIWVNRELTLENVTITGNTSTYLGAGVYVSNDSYYAFTIGGTVIIDGNYLVDKDASGNQTRRENGRSNLTMKGSQDVCGATNDAALTTDSKIGVSIEGYTSGESRRITGNTSIVDQKLGDAWPSVFYADNTYLAVIEGTGDNDNLLFLTDTSKSTIGVTAYGGDDKTVTKNYSYGDTVELKTSDYPKSGVDDKGNACTWTLTDWTVTMGGETTSYSPNDGVTSFTVTSPATAKANYMCSYAVSFETNNGEKSDPVTVQAGYTVSKPSDPKRDRYIFDGWYTDEECTQAFDFSTPITSNLTLYAKWSEEIVISFNPGENATVNPTQTVIGRGHSLGTLPYPIPSDTNLVFTGWIDPSGNTVSSATTFDEGTVLSALWTVRQNTCVVTFMDGSDVWQVAQVASGSTVKNLDEPVKTHAKFEGWYTDEACTVGHEWDASAPVTSNTTVYAKWSVEQLTVTFKGNLEDVDDFTQSVDYGKALSEPASPQRDGYIFTGWYTTWNCFKQYDFSKPVTGDITLYAGWKDAETVTFEMGGAPAVASQTVAAGSRAQQPADPTWEDHIFGGWYADADFTKKFDFGDAITTDTTIYAKWIDAVTVRFDAFGATSQPEAKVIEKGTSLGSLPVVKSGYSGLIFTGWIDPYGNAITGTTTFDMSMTLSATWTAAENTCVVIFKSGSEDWQGVQVNAGSKVPQIGEPSKEGYTFGGWYTDEACTAGNEWDADAPVTKDTTVYAKWTANTYTVTFVNVDSTVATQSVTYGEKAIKPADPTRDGFIFDGWYTNKACTDAYDFGTAVSGDVTLYAGWKEVGSYFTVSFDTNGGAAIDAQVVEKGAAATQPADPVREGYVFDGWYADKECSKAFDFNSPITGNATAYAKWAEAVTVTFEAAGATTKPEAKVIKKGASLGSLPVVQNTNEEIYFAGWIDSEGSSVSGATTFDKDATLNAVWAAEKDVFFVTFKDGDNVYEVVTVIDGEPVEIADPTKAGYTFKGWYTDKDCTAGHEWYSGSTIGAEVEAMYAKWEANTYTVTFVSGESTVATQSVKYGEKAAQPADPSRDGYDFTGWYADASCTKAFDFSGAVSGDTTVYAGWRQKDSGSTPGGQGGSGKTNDTTDGKANGSAKKTSATPKTGDTAFTGVGVCAVVGGAIVVAAIVIALLKRRGNN